MLASFLISALYVNYMKKMSYLHRKQHEIGCLKDILYFIMSHTSVILAFLTKMYKFIISVIL